MALTYSKGMPLGTTAPDFTLPGVDDRTHTLSDFGDKPLLVVVFTCNHCPYARAVEGRLVALQDAYQDRGVQIVAINANDAAAYPEDSFPNMQRRAREKHFNFPYLYDESQAVARAYGAACTPDIFLFDAARRLQYNGRLDDNWQDEHGVSQRDLERAIACVRRGDPVDFKTTPSMGCNIKWR